MKIRSISIRYATFAAGLTAALTGVCAPAIHAQEMQSGRGYFFPALIPSYFDKEHFLEDISIERCELKNGYQSLCYKLKVKSNPVENGPYCPETINDIGGVYPYDGATNPGLRVLKRDLFEDMEADGYDIVDDDGNIRFIMIKTGEIPNLDPDLSYCIEVEPDNTLQLSYMIPVFSWHAQESTPMDDASKIVGLSLIGMPINGLPPSVANGIPGAPTGVGSMPALDACGGHINEGFYHSHIFPETINEIYAKHHIGEVRCEAVYPKGSGDLVAYAMDGYPIYTHLDMNGATPTGLDECNGHFGPTIHYPTGMYHYHSSSAEDVNIPRCLKGVMAKQQLIVE
ncbi:YHYH protein [Hahella aquimaris]|uniref:YHYH protein n=1 Tax=Hahella sp. HNIBRBA332 TaxID=3015983 RepID=UPI00273C8E4A|nr:YHYH protein [Hahella sp. HNIBRBA332]WLQ14213.1 YHYH protein [Hahella sp. HNIBRBA332]